MRDVNQSPIMDRFNLVGFTDGLIDDLRLLREGKISTHEAHARANLAKQILKAINYTIIAQKFLVENAQNVQQIDDKPKGKHP